MPVRQPFEFTLGQGMVIKGTLPCRGAVGRRGALEGGGARRPLWARRASGQRCPIPHRRRLGQRREGHVRGREEEARDPPRCGAAGGDSSGLKAMHGGLAVSGSWRQGLRRQSAAPACVPAACTARVLCVLRFFSSQQRFSAACCRAGLWRAWRGRRDTRRQHPRIHGERTHRQVPALRAQPGGWGAGEAVLRSLASGRF